MKDRLYRPEDLKAESSKGSSSFSKQYVREGLRPPPSFTKLPQNKVSPSMRDLNSKRKEDSRRDLQGLFTNDILPKRMDKLVQRSHLGFVKTPQKYEKSEISQLNADSVVYSPRQVLSNYSPKPNFNNERQLYEKRIRQLTKDWAIQKSTMKKQIKQLEFIVQQWQLLDDRKHTSNSRTQISQTIVRDLGSPRQSVVLVQLKKKLEACEYEKQEMYRDFAQLEKQLKKVRFIGNFDNSQLSQVRQLQLTDNSSSFRYEKELQTVKCEYERVILEKDNRYQQLMTDFTELQQQLQKQRRQTMILLQKRTNQLESNLVTLKVANDDINSDLRSAIDRINHELQQEKKKNKTLENELAHRDHTKRLVENELSLSKKTLEELRETHMKKCIELEMIRIEPSKNDNYKRQDVVHQTSWQQQRTKDFDLQVNFEDPSLPRRQSAMLQKYKEQNEKLTRKCDQLEQILAEKQHSIRSLTANNKQLDASVRKLQANYNNVLKDKARLQLQLRKQTSERQALDLRVVRGLGDGNRDKQLGDMRLQRAMSKKQIELLKSELEECRHKIDIFRSQQQNQKINTNSQERVTRNNYEVAIHNLTGQLDSSKIKLEGVEARLQIKKRELREKDDFIRNTIVSRLGKQTSESEVQYMIRKMDEFVDAYRQKQQ